MGSDRGMKADFYCTVCGKVVEDYPLKKKPPTCCRKIMQRKYTPTPTFFRGTGWPGAGLYGRDYERQDN